MYFGDSHLGDTYATWEFDQKLKLSKSKCSWDAIAVIEELGSSHSKDFMHDFDLKTIKWNKNLWG